MINNKAKILISALMVLSLAFLNNLAFAGGKGSGKKGSSDAAKKGEIPSKKMDFDDKELQNGKIPQDPITGHYGWHTSAEMQKWLREFIKKQNFQALPQNEKTIPPLIYIPVPQSEITPSNSTGSTPEIEPVSPEGIEPVSPEDINPGHIYFPDGSGERITWLDREGFIPEAVDALYVSSDYGTCQATGGADAVKYVLVGGAVVGIAACVLAEGVSLGSLSFVAVPATAALVLFIKNSLQDAESGINKRGEDLISYEFEGNAYIFSCEKQTDGVLCAIENS